MVFRKISKDMKERAIWLLDRGWLSNEVLEIFGISKRSLQRWRRNLRVHGSVIPPKSPFQGRPPILNALQMHDLVEAISKSPELFLDEIQDWILISTDIGLSRSTIHKIVRDLGFTYKYLSKAALERDEELRREWMEEIQSEFVAAQMVFVDESSKDDRTIYRRFGRAPRGMKAATGAKFVRGTRYSIIAAITVDGYIGTRVVEGSVDGVEFIDYILEEVVGFLYNLVHDKILTIPIYAVTKDESVPAGSQCFNS